MTKERKIWDIQWRIFLFFFFRGRNFIGAPRPPRRERRVVPDSYRLKPPRRLYLAHGGKDPRNAHQHVITSTLRAEFTSSYANLATGTMRGRRARPPGSPTRRFDGTVAPKEPAPKTHLTTKRSELTWKWRIHDTMADLGR